MSPLADKQFFWTGLDEIRGEQKVSAMQEEEFKEDPDKEALVNPERQRSSSEPFERGSASSPIVG